MNKYLILSSFMTLTACTAHVGYNDIGRAFSGFSAQQGKLSVQQCAFYATKRAAEQAEQELDYKQNLLNSLDRSLSENDAWNGQFCQKPAAKLLPPKPNSISHEQAAFQATGACMDLASRRHSSEKIERSLIAIRQEKLSLIYKEWKQSPKAQCALSYMPSQALDFVVRMCGMFGQEASNSCLMDYIGQCQAEVMQSCRAEHIAWQEQVAAIKAAPEQALQSCQNMIVQIEDIQRDLPRLHMTAQLNREEHGKTKQPNISEAMCR